MTTRMIAILFGLLLAACGTGQTADPVYVSEADSGRTVVLTSGQELFVTLTGNATTGYSWSQRFTVDGVLGVVGETEYLPDQPVIPGSGGRERFRFRAVRTGRTTASFEYRRPWETSSAAAQTATYDIVVE
jgi:predicted secreted protein